MSEITTKKILFGSIDVNDFKDNLFAMKLIEKISKIDEEAILQQSRSAFLMNFIISKSAFDLFFETVNEPTVTRKAKSLQEVNLNHFSDEAIDFDAYKFIYERINHLPVTERGKYLMQLALTPSLINGDDSTLDLFGEKAISVSEMLRSSSKEERMEALFHGAVFKSLKANPSKQVNLGNVIFNDESLRPVNSDGKAIDIEYSDEAADEAIKLINGFNAEDLNLFMVRAIMEYAKESRGIFFRKQFNLPYLFSEKQPGVIALDLDAPIPNSFIEIFKAAYDLKNNRVKDRFGASDASMLRFKNDINGPVRDPVTAMLVRAYCHYPELLVKTLPKEIDIRGVIQYIGGSDRSLGVYIGRNPFTAHRYLSKKQERPQHIELLLEIFARFVQEGRIQEYIENILIPEAKARGVDDIFSASGWPKDIEES